MSKLYKNASGYYDPTAFNAIVDADSDVFDSEKTKEFVNDIFKVCRTHGIFVEGELTIFNRRNSKRLRKITLYRPKEKGE